MESMTSSFRISKELHRRLMQAAERSGKGKNRIITEALVNYLGSLDRDLLAAEARRQSELVSRNEHETGWYDIADTAGWK